MHTAMVIIPHSDDAVLFCGGTLAKFAAEGWRIILVHVTDDTRDSVGLTAEEAKRRNAGELQESSRAVGVAEIVELGFPTDSLADVPLGQVRERIVYHLRKHQPYAVFSFDPDQLGEDNMDHVRTAQAVTEAFWVAAFDLHYPEHFSEGLSPFSVCERWYFGRELARPNHIEEVTDFIPKKIEAFLYHQTQIANILHQLILQARTWGRRIKIIEDAANGDPRELVSMFLTEQAEEMGNAWNLGEGKFGEVFRLERFGHLEPLFQLHSEPIPGAESSVRREGLDK